MRISKSSLALSAASFLFSLLTIPLIANIFTPSEYGAWIIVFTWSTLLGYVVNLRFDRAISISKSIEESLTLMIISFLVTVIALFLYLLIALCLYPEHYERILEIFFFTILSSVSLNVYALSNRGGQILTGISGQAINTTGAALISIIVNETFKVENALYLGTSAAYLVSILIGLRNSHKLKIETSALLKMQTITQYRRLMTQYKRFPLYFTPITLASLIRDRAIYLILGVSGNNNIVGIYSLANRIVSAPNSVTAGVVRPRFIEKLLNPTTSKVDLSIDIRRINSLFLRIMSIFCAALIVQGEYLVIHVLGDNWANMSLVFTIICWVGTLQLLTGWLDRSFDFKNSQKYIAQLEIATCTLCILVFIQTTIWNLDPLLVVLEFSAINIGYYLAMLKEIYELHSIELNVIPKSLLQFIFLTSIQVLILYATFLYVGPLVSFIATALFLILSLRGREIFGTRKASSDARL
jgi:O-antigen/teichoic acid export membrane protein